MKYLFDCEPMASNNELQLVVENYKLMEKGTKFSYQKAEEKYMFEHFRFLCLQKDIQITKALCALISLSIARSIVHLELYAKTLKEIKKREKCDVVHIKDFLKYFKNGFPSSVEIKKLIDFKEGV